MAQLSRDLRSRGIDILDMSLGEPDFDTPVHIREAAKKGMDQGYTHYPPVAGYLDLREAICEKFRRDNGFYFIPEQVVVSTGAKQSLANLMMALLNPGDEVLLPEPYWVSYRAQVKMAEGIPVEIPTTIETDFKISPEQLEAAITPKSKMFLFSSPCNPTGSVYTRDELAALAEVFARHPQIIIISDEIYELINFNPPHESIYQFEELRHRCVIVNGLSKAFAMTGWRLGYMAGPVEIAKACTKIQGQYTSGASTISQRAAMGALLSDYAPTFAMRDQLLQRRDLLIRELEPITGMKLNHPLGAFYLFPDISYYIGKSINGTTVQDNTHLCLLMLEEAHVAIVTGRAFGNEQCIRLNFAIDEDKIKTAGQRLREFFAKFDT